MSAQEGYLHPESGDGLTLPAGGRGALYTHHGAWWVYYRDDAGPHRKKVGSACNQAEPVAARVNLQGKASLAKKLWWDAGAVKADKIRQVVGRVTAAIGHPDSICPKSWRHTFATLLQDANVDPLIRQQVMGHKATLQGGLGMTVNYTHTRPETRKEQVEQALRRWPESFRLAAERVGSGPHAPATNPTRGPVRPRVLLPSPGAAGWGRVGPG